MRYGWAPQQMLACSGLGRYGYFETAQRLAYNHRHPVGICGLLINGQPFLRHLDLNGTW